MKLLATIKGLAVAAAVAVTSVAATAPAMAEGLLEEIQKRGKLRVGMATFVPWAMRDTEGNLIGFEIDVAQKLADDMGVDVEWTPTAWDGIIPALVAGQFDVIISGMSIRPSRNLTVNFTQPYAYSGATVLANIEMTQGFTLEDFNSPDVTFAARRGATTVETIMSVFPNAQIVQFDDEGAPTQEVLNGNVHATMSSEPLPSTEARRYPDTLYVPFDYAFEASGEAFAVRKGDPDAINFFNNWIGLHERNGWLKERHDYWFRGEEWADMVPE